MTHLAKTKLAVVTIAVIALLPSDAIASFTNPGLTQASLPMLGDQPSTPGNGTPGRSHRSASGTHDQPPPRTDTPGNSGSPGGTHAIPSPPGTGTPDSPRIPGGSRPGSAETCKQTDKPLTALVPENGKGLTTAEHPVFWFYVPYASDDIHSIEFSLHDRDDKTTLYRTSLQLTKTPGVVGISLPPSPKHSLKLNESYHWRLVVNCDRKETSENVLELDGWVTRVQQSSNSVIWYDELTNRAKRYMSEPQNPETKKAWAELLKSIGLEELEREPLVGSVSNLKNN